MASSLGGIFVDIGLNSANFQKGVTQVQRQAAGLGASLRKSLGGIQNEFGLGLGKGLLGGIAAGFSAGAVKNLLDSATHIKNALKVAGLAGDDLTKVYERLFAAAQKNGAPLETLAVLYGRAAQNQKELSASTEQLLGFTDNVALALRVAGTDATTASGALLQLGQALGSGTVHAEEFNSVLEGVPTIAQAVAAGIKDAGGSVAKLKALVVDGKVSSKAFFDGFAAGAETLAEKAAGAETTISAGFVRLQNVLVDVATRFDDSTHASRTLANMIDHTLIPAIQELGGIFTSVANGPIGQFYDWLGKTIDRVVQLSADLGAMTGLDKIGGNPYIGQGRIQERIDAAFGGATYSTPKDNRSGTEITVNNGTVTKPITLADYPVTGAKSGKGRSGSRRTADDSFAQSIQEIRDRTAALKEEQATLGATYEEQTRRSLALEMEQETLRQVREEARRKGDQDWQNAQLSPEQVKAIDDVSSAYAKQADTLRKTQDAMDLSKDVMKGVLGDLRSALDDGKLDWQDFANIAVNALDRITLDVFTLEI